MRVLVAGAGGHLGAAVASECARGHDVSAFDRRALDVADAAAVARAVADVRPDAIINCAAFTDVDGAEDRPVDALRVNAFAVRSLARAARTHGAVLVHYSTDFVFDGTASAPHTEDETPNPRGVYAASKLLGEWFAADAPAAYVLRVESLFGAAADGSPGKGSVAGIVSALRAGRAPKAFEDRTVSPTHVGDAARATRELIERRAPPGLYHCVNTGHCTWLELAVEAARLLGVEPNVEPVRLADLRLRAPRPLYCALSNDKLTALGIAMPSWREALARYVTALVRAEGSR